MAIRLFGRLLSLGILVAVALVAWPMLQRQRALQEAALAEIEREQEQVAALGAPAPAPLPAAPSAQPEAPRAERSYYRYQGADGSLHFVDSLERVPEALRASARAIAMAAEPARSTPPTPSRPSSAPSARPFERVASLPAARRPPAAAEVVVYTTSWCGWCRKTLAWLDERGVSYENRDIERSDAWRDELVEKTGSVSIPVVEIDGQLVRGFDPGRMGELL
jgi:glutaredoxin